MSKKKTKEERKSRSQNLIEYFYLFGVEPDSINVDRFDKQKNYLQKGFLIPDLLSKFPPGEKSDINIDTRIVKSHCFPKGYTLVTKNVAPVEEFFYFNLDNMISIDSSDKVLYFACVQFYEPLTKYVKIKNLKNKTKNKPNENIRKTKSKKKDSLLDNVYIPKVLCISSFMPFPHEFKILLTKLINYSKSEKIIYPIEKIIENMVYGIPRPPRAFFDVHCKKNISLFPKQDFELDFQISELNQYCSYSYKYQSIFNFCIEDILDIYKSLLLEAPVLFFCSKKELLTNVFESFMILLHPFEYQNPHVSILPDINAGIIEMAPSFAFGINHEWVIPGNNEKRPTYFQKFNLNIINKKILICDIDKNKIYKYYNANPFQHIISFEDLGNYSAPEGTDPLLCRSKDINNTCFNNWNEYALPEHYTKKLKNKLKTYIEKCTNMNYRDYNLKTNKEIGEQTFYYYLASIFQTYNDFVFQSKEEIDKICADLIKYDLKDINIETLYNVKGFISANNKDNSFFIKFFETNMFKDYLKRKYLFRECDKYTILNFDEAISAKKNKKWFSKKIKTEFKETKLLKFVKNYNVKQTKDFGKDEYAFIESHNDKLIRYYQQYKNKAISYLIFPKFLYDNSFFDCPFQTTVYHENELNYMIEDSYKAIDKLNDNNIFAIYNSEFANIYLFDISKHSYPAEMDNSLYLLWLNIFCLTLHYCDEKEKEFRYEQMIDYLSRITFDKSKVIKILESALSKYGVDKNMIRFFENLNPITYSSYCNLTVKFLNEKKAALDLKKMNIANTRLSINYYRESKATINIFDIINSNSVKVLKPRTFDVNTSPSLNPKENSSGPTKELVYFDDMVKCDRCKKSIEIGILTINFKDMNKDGSFKCPECRQPFTPKIKVQCGNIIDNIYLYSIYYLYTFSNDLIKIYGTKLIMDDLRTKYRDFFWNCIWYFGLKGLSYDMLLKYKFINYYSCTKDERSKPKNKFFDNLVFQNQNVDV
jgi:hypothetical protein